MFKENKDVLVGIGAYVLVMGMYQAVQSANFFVSIVPVLIEKAITGVLVVVFIICTPIVLKKLNVRI